MRRLLLLLALAGLAAGGTAIAVAQQSDPYVAPEPEVRSGQVLRLASASGCRSGRMLRVRFSPPFGAIFGSFDVRIGGRSVARLTGIPRAASVTVRLPRGRSTVLVTGETLGGQRVRSERTYRTCGDVPAPAPAPGTGGGGDDPVTVGGGED